MGIEHAQMDAIRALYTTPLAHPGTSPLPFLSIDRTLAYPARSTPNQLACAAALALGYFRDPRPAMVLLDAMDEHGHQSTTAGGYGWEAGAPDPHSLIWLGAMACLLWQTSPREQNLDTLHARVIKYFSDHMALCAAFWTLGGVRVPCSRAKTGDGKPLRPTWTVDSAVYGMITGADIRLSAKPGPDANVILDMLNSCRADFSPIVRGIKPSQVKLHIPIRRWDCADVDTADTDGGFTAALVRDEPANDRLSWLDVARDGTYHEASNALSTMIGINRHPDLIFGDTGANDVAADDVDVDVSTFPARLSALRVNHKDQLVITRALAQLPNATSATYAQIADSVSRFGIGTNQAQYGEWRRLIDDLKAAGDVLE